jgi:hypothetical protein
MRQSSTLAHFRRAILLTLAGLPACGGIAETTVPAGTGDGGSHDAQAIPEASLPDTGCDWQRLPPLACGGCNAACMWQLGFTGDPVACAGFTGSGTNAQCAALCGDDMYGEPANNCTVTPSGAGGTVYCQVLSTPNCVNIMNGGRRPAYFASLGFGPAPTGRELGAHFARAACMEAAAIEAFFMLRDELVAHGAPRSLVKAAERAARDEMRHVKQTAALARRFGEQPIAPRPVPPRPRRSFPAVVLENAVEGCVRETYSALECAWQAEQAADPVVRATMKQIARDELRHLDLSWAIHAWALGRLDAAGRRRVIDAQNAEIATLLGELARDPHPTLVATGGLPRAAQSRSLVGAIAERIAA